MGDTRPWQTLAARASMPWLETAPMNERERFIADFRLDLYTMTELCARYNVARKTGYKWLDRMAQGGRAALRDRSRAPHHCPHRTAAEVAPMAGATGAGRRLAGPEHGGRSARAPRVGETTAAPPAALPSGRGGASDARAVTSRPIVVQ